MRYYLLLYSLFLSTYLFGQQGEGVSISISQQRYQLHDTIFVHVSQQNEVDKAVYVDLVNPFGETVSMRKGSDSIFSIPLMPFWESGFYELRLYKDVTAPVIASRIIPILPFEDTDSIPVWQTTSNSEQTDYPEWFQHFRRQPENLKGLLVTKKGIPWQEEGLTVTVSLYNERESLLWSGKCTSASHGEFAINVPYKSSNIMRIKVTNKRGKKVKCNFVFIPQAKAGILTDNYTSEIARLSSDLGLQPYAQDDTARIFYLYDMREQAIAAYFAQQRIPKMMEWFMSHPVFAHAMKKGHRAVGWNASQFSMYPPKRMKLDDMNYVIHDLYRSEKSSPLYLYTTFGCFEIGRRLYPREDTPSQRLSREGAPRLRINQMAYIVVLAGHSNAPLLPENRSYLKVYDPIMVFYQ